MGQQTERGQGIGNRRHLLAKRKELASGLVGKQIDVLPRLGPVTKPGMGGRAYLGPQF
jgi:hypothetical protein